MVELRCVNRPSSRSPVWILQGKYTTFDFDSKKQLNLVFSRVGFRSRFGPKNPDSNLSKKYNHRTSYQYLVRVGSGSAIFSRFESGQS